MCVCLSFLPRRVEDGEDDPWDNLIKAGKREGKTRISFFPTLPMETLIASNFLSL